MCGGFVVTKSLHRMANRRPMSSVPIRRRSAIGWSARITFYPVPSITASYNLKLVIPTLWLIISR